MVIIYDKSPRREPRCGSRAFRQSLAWRVARSLIDVRHPRSNLCAQRVLAVSCISMNSYSNQCTHNIQKFKLSEMIFAVGKEARVPFGLPVTHLSAERI